MIPPSINPESLPKATVVRLELFPAAVSMLPVTVPEGDLKVVVTDTHLLVLANSPHGPYLAFTGVLYSYSQFNRTTRTWDVVLEDGQEIAISRATSCGCGSRLRGVRLYPAAPRTM